jgi:hypothetical protein
MVDCIIIINEFNLGDQKSTATSYFCDAPYSIFLIPSVNKGVFAESYLALYGDYAGETNRHERHSVFFVNSYQKRKYLSDKGEC